MGIRARSEHTRQGRLLAYGGDPCLAIFVVSIVDCSALIQNLLMHYHCDIIMSGRGLGSGGDLYITAAMLLSRDSVRESGSN